MESIISELAELRARFDSLRPRGSEAPTDLQRKYDIEQTYASNAIEGNTLSLGETAEIIEHGITVGGKHIREHLEAIDHFDAIQWMRQIAHQKTPIGEETITELHRRIVMRSRPEIAGTYAQHARRIVGSPMVFPNPVKVPQLMSVLGRRIAESDGTPRAAFDAHYRLVTIHPFDDGNGRTARLLANMMLIRSGYVPVTVRPEDRREYLDHIKTAQLAQDDQAPGFQEFMHRRLVQNLRQYVDDLSQGREGMGVAGQGAQREEGDEQPRQPVRRKSAAPSRNNGWEIG